MAEGGVLELTVSCPVWCLPSCSPQEIQLELYLRVCAVPYVTRRSIYPYSTATGSVRPLPLLRERHLAFAPALPAVEHLRRRLLRPGRAAQRWQTAR